MSLRVITKADGFPVSLADVKAHLRIETGAEDTMLGAYLAAATEKLQNHVQKRYITQTLEWVLQDCRCGILRLPLAPVSDVVSVKYTDADGELQTVDPQTYVVTTGCQATFIYPKCGNQWPEPQECSEPIVIRFQVGTSAADVPANVKIATLMLVAHFYANRSAVIVPTGNDPKELPVGVSAMMQSEAWD